ncbi:MAG: hypothetical protein DCF22_24935 [Leptolyngbya sp.]|nr:MAG: hypothetical protein DCF22_24935 [Leptolyngbya sp.]
MNFRPELIDELLKEYRNPEDLMGEGGVLCTIPQKGIVHNKTNESYFKKLLGLCLRLQQTLHSRETSRNFMPGIPAFHKV